MALTADFVTNATLTFARMRMLLEEQAGGLQEGVIGANDLKVVQRGAGANMSVDVGVGAGWVDIDSGTRQGFAHVYNDAVANAVVTAAHATLPRIDQIVLQHNDAAIPAGVGGSTPTIRVIAGTATSGATLDNRTGAAALPSDALRLADVLVPAASSSVVTANIRDRRPWARGAYRRLKRTAGDLSTASLTYIDLAASELQVRMELSGAPIRLRLFARIFNSLASNGVRMQWVIDGAVPETYSMSALTPTNAQDVGPTAAGALDYNGAPTAGTRLIKPQWQVAVGGTATFAASGTIAAFMTVEELVRQDADNGAS